MGGKTPFSCGFIAIIGAPNVGKSTLLNRMLGQKISITSKKPQTTRNRILGIVNRPESQLIFVDTPGVHRTRAALNTRIVETALSALADVDVVLFMLDAAGRNPEAESIIKNALDNIQKPVFLVVNKTDLVHQKETLLALIDTWATRFSPDRIIPVSALTGDQVDALLNEIETVLPEGPRLFPEDAVTDMPERFLAGEIIREKAFRSTGEEIPYAVAVTVDEFKDMPGKRTMVRISATLHVERESQKGIVIGKKGAKLKQIGRDARCDMERLLDCRVYLSLFVRVQKNWSRDTRALRRFGY